MACLRDRCRTGLSRVRVYTREAAVVEIAPRERRVRSNGQGVRVCGRQPPSTGPEERSLLGWRSAEGSAATAHNHPLLDKTSAVRMRMR